jgi:DNA-binding NarL/FixJ family response regulator
MGKKIRVAILDDHQSIIDGYKFRLSKSPEVEVVATALYGTALEPLLADLPVDVLLLDINVPISADNPNPYPFLHTIPKLLHRYPALKIIAISMHNQRSLIRAAVDTGISGYILKDDQSAIRNLGTIICSIVVGGVYYSEHAHEAIFPQSKDNLLSARQLEVLSVCAAYPDATTGELASKLDIAPSTVRNLLSNAYLRLGVRSRAAAIVKAQELGLLLTQETPPQY